MKISDFEVGLWVRSADGFAMSGDAAAAHTRGGMLVLAIIDALGHGPEAHAAATMAEDLIARSESSDITALLAMLNEELAASVGAAVGLTTINAETGEGTYVGIGNTVARIIGQTERRLVSIDGIVGKRHVASRPAAFMLAPGDTLLLYTDGISSRAAVSDYRGLLSDDVDTAAREMIRRFGRNHDDSACIVARRAP